MIAEILLVLAGHESSLFPEDYRLHSDFVPLLHPGERQCLESLGLVAFRYRKIKAACGRMSLSPSPYICAFSAKLSEILRDEYESLVISTEAKILTRDDSLVGQGSFVPLSSIKALFATWENPFAALETLVNLLEQEPNWSSGRLIDTLIERSEAGTHSISSLMSKLAAAVQHIWRSHLQAFLIHGTIASSFPLAAEDYTLREDAMPSCVSPAARDSIKYVGRAVGTVQASKWRKQLPSYLLLEHTRLLDSVLPQDQHAFDRVIAQIRREVSEWLWTNVLTLHDVENAVDSLANYFLLQNGEFCLSLIREIDRLKQSRFTARSGPSTVIREQDLQLAMLRASLGTSAQHDPALSHIRLQLPSGPVRPLLPTLQSSISSVEATKQTRFDDILLGTHLCLLYDISWPLDLFLHPSDLAIYADLFSFLSSLRHIQNRVHNCWTALSNAQRARRRWTGLNEGGTQDQESRKDLLRCGWGVIRRMGWFLDVILGYMMTDVVETEFLRLKRQLKPSNIGPSTSSKNDVRSLPSDEFGGASSSPLLDFNTLRTLHSSYLERLLSGSLLTQNALTATIQAVLEVCDRFVGQVERWGGDILPALLFEGSIRDGENAKVGQLVLDRWEIVKEIDEEVNTLLETFYGQLTSATTQSLSLLDASRSFSISAAGNSSLLQTSVSRKQRNSEKEGEARRHVERLLLRMDFNRMFSRPFVGEVKG